MSRRVVPQTAQKASTDYITGALWNAGPKALGDFTLNLPIFRGYAGTTQVLTTGTWAVLSLDNTDVDSDSGHSNVTNNARYTAQVPGWYWVEGYFAMTNAGAAGRWEASIAKNGTIVGASATYLLRQNDLQGVVAMTLVQLAVNDYVTVQGRQNTGISVATFAGGDLACALNVFWVHS